MVADGDGPDRSVHGLFERDHDVALDVASAFGRILLVKTGVPAETRAAALASAGPRPEHLFEEVTEPGAAKMELELPGAGAGAPKAARTRRRSPSRRWTEVRARFPVCAQLVVFVALGRIAQDFVGFVDFLELFLGFLFVFGDVGMEFAGEFAECFLD